MFSGLRSILNGLTSDPGGTILTLVYVAVCILFSLIIHECAHGYVALKCGDPTAKWLGRLTLDPRKHLDPLGTICMVFMRIGWAKPVPVNPRNFRHYRRDYILVSIAGIAVNLLICILSLIISAILAKIIWGSQLVAYFAEEGDKSLLINVYEGVFANRIYGGKFTELVCVQRTAEPGAPDDDVYFPHFHGTVHERRADRPADDGEQRGHGRADESDFTDHIKRRDEYRTDDQPRI